MDILREEIDLSLLEAEIVETQQGVNKIKTFYIKGPFLQAEVINGNKRVYPRAVLENEVNRHIATKIKENRALGELGHPQSSEINLDRVSHLIKELTMDGNTVIGKAQILDTPMGKIAKALMESNVKLGVSSRGVGSLKNGVVQNDYRLICVDIVSDPSGPNCFVDGIMESNKEWVMENNILVEKEIQEIQQQVDKVVVEHKYNAEEKQAAFLAIFQQTINKIKTR